MKTNAIKYQGYSRPNYTPVPDELFDEQLPDLSGAELKVLLYIIRRTFGFKKDSDNISLNQLLNGITSKDGVVLDRGTGLSKKTLLETIRSLVEKNLVITERRRSAERGDEPTTYRLHIVASRASQDTENADLPRGVKSSPGGGEKSTPGGWSKKSPTQETVKQETDVHLRNSKANHQEEDGPEQRPYQQSRAGEGSPTRTGTPIPITTILSKRKESLPQLSSEKPNGKLTPTPQIMAVITEISEYFGDTKHLRSNISQAVNLWSESGRSEALFVSTLYEARAITRQQQQVRKPMPYFWRVVRELLGVDASAIRVYVAADAAG